jgi:DNA primase
VAGLIRRDDIDEVRSRADIAAVIGDHVALKSAGVGSLRGLCPFHDERTPSFYVRPQVGRYHCFGCGEDGDVFTFLQKLDMMSFTESVERMAAKVGLELHYEDGGPATADHGNRARILSANQAASDWFIGNLGSPDAEAARAFLGERGFDPAAAQRFGVGFAPRSFDALKLHLGSLGYSAEESLTAGLLSAGDRGPYDRFRGRLVWPIRDVTGQTLGFGARRLFDDDKGPKYLNTPETPVYHKSSVLYGIDLAKRDISRGRQVVVVEGYTDVMACHLAGVTTAVATCGTSFGVDHIKIVRRMLGDVENADTRGLGEVVFTFDPDEAGQKAASRAFGEEQRFAAQTFVAVAPDGLDPCDLRLERGDEAVRRLVRTRRPMFEFMIRRVLDAHDLETAEGRVAGLRAAAPLLADIRDGALGVEYARTTAGWLGIDPDEVISAVRSAAIRADAARRGGTQRDTGGQRATGGHRGAEGRSEAGGTSGPSGRRETDGRRPEDGRADEASAPGASMRSLPDDLLTRLERDAIMALLQHPETVDRDLAARAAQSAFSNTSLAVVRDAIAVSMDDWATPRWLDRVIDEVPLPFQPLVKELGVAPIPVKGDDRIGAYCTGLAVALIDRDLLRQKGELLGRLQRMHGDADPERSREVQQRLMAVEQERRTLRAD